MTAGDTAAKIPLGYYPKRTSRKPIVVDGVTWLSWQTGISRFAMRSEDSRLEVRANLYAKGNTYSASGYAGAEGWVNIGKQYRSEKGAMRAAAAWHRKNQPPATPAAETQEEPSP
jgi:hypothetical protein